MISRQLFSLALGLAAASPSVMAQKAGSIVEVGNTTVSAMMMFLGTENKVYILDKSEGNPTQINGHPAMAAVWDIQSHSSVPMELTTNAFCSSGYHLPNGSYITLGGNGAVGPGGNISDVLEPGGFTGLYSTKYGDWDGTKAIRILDPCDSDNADLVNNPQCNWFDNSSLLSMQQQRWYSTAEALGDGSIAIIGGYTSGGYINRNYPNVDPEFEGGAATCTYEFFPSKGPLSTLQFLIHTSGLNAYPHAFTMPDGRMFLQANYSTILWDPLTNQETPLPDMPGEIIRVYPASGATAMLPLTPENNYTPTIMFCGGSNMTDFMWGNYSWPFYNTWEWPASERCHQITPEPIDGSAPEYVEVDPMPEGRTMGQMILLPDGTALVVNGGLNGTAGYSTMTLDTLSYAEMPNGMSLASGPVGTPAIFNPKAPAGKQWTNAGFDTSSIARLYHSSALLLPDASVMIAGSNPNVDYNDSTVFSTEYRAEYFYPPYFQAATRPSPQGIPKTLSYGGSPFDLTIPASSYSGSADDAADNTTVMLIRPGWTTHGMNMGQRALQLNNTYTVNSDGTITLHVAQLPPNPNIFQPGPTLFFVNIYGIPSNGTMVIVGSGQIETQPTQAASVLPPSIRLGTASGSAPNTTKTTSANTPSQSSGASHTGAIIGGIVGAIALVGILGAAFGICLTRRRRAGAQQRAAPSYPMGAAASGLGGGAANREMRNSDSSAFVPLQQGNASMTWANTSTANLNTPYHDDFPRTGSSGEFDPYYQNAPRMSTNAAR